MTMITENELFDLVEASDSLYLDAVYMLHQDIECEIVQENDSIKLEGESFKVEGNDDSLFLHRYYGRELDGIICHEIKINGCSETAIAELKKLL